MDDLENIILVAAAVDNKHYYSVLYDFIENAKENKNEDVIEFISH